MQPKLSELRVPFLHGFPVGPIAGPSELASLEHADAWLNSPPLTASALGGKVVLVNFWTYTCINWLRTLPYVRAWAEKYRDPGLVVIGVHTPEFAFERDQDNVRRAVREMRVDYPVAVDSEYAIWDAFNNQYWPALYFIDANGHLRHQQFGEGSYREAEMVLQELLEETGKGSFDRTPVSVDGEGLEAAPDWDDLQSGENYVGYARAQGFASPGGVAYDTQQAYQVPANLAPNEWALSGDWTIRKDAAALNGAQGGITYRFHARDLHLVMGPAARGTSVPFRVLIDGKPPGAAHGADIDDDGNGHLTEQRLHQLIRQPGPITDRNAEIQFLGAGAELFAFTFG